MILIAGAVASTSAQQRGPEEPDETQIVVPDLILTVEELPLESVKATLPAEEELRLGDLSLPLPVPGEIEIDQAAFFLSAPDVTAVPTEGSSIYSTGLLGAGTANHVVGEISLFKLGEDPRFRLRFFYEGLDGFQFEPPGTGYFHRENQVEGSVEASSPDLSLETSALFAEQTIGLQGQSPFYSVGLRSIGGTAETVVRPDPLLELSGRVGGRFASRLQSASNVGSAPRDREFALAPGLGVQFTLGTVVLSARTDYEFQLIEGVVDDLVHRFDGRLGLSFAPDSRLRIDADVGAYSEFADAIYYPWSLGVQLAISESFEADVYGGYRQLPLSFLDLWNAWALVATGTGPDANQALVTPGEWYGGARVRWSPGPGIVTTTEAEYHYRSNAVELISYDPIESRHDVRQRLLQNVRVGTTIGYNPMQQLSLQVNWDVVLLDRLVTDPLSSVGGSFQLRSQDGRLSLAADASVELYPEPTIPEINLTGTVVITEGVALDLVVHDPLAPLFTDGRPTIGSLATSEFPFIEPGLRASLLARISL
jgi:hypothetical protein